MPQSPESKTRKKESLLRPLIILGFVAVGLVKGGVVDDFVSSLDTGKASAAAQAPPTPETSVEIPVTVAAEVLPVPEVSSDMGLEVGIAHDSWVLAPNYAEIIDSLDKTDNQKVFMKRAVEAIYLAIQNGALINPRVVFDQILIETGFGTDGISGADEGNNMIGQRAWGDEPYIWAWTKEYNAATGKWERMKAKFRKFNSPDESIMAYAKSLANLKHYADALNCRHDDKLFIEGLEDERDPATCELIRAQGHLDDNGNVDVLSYGTDPGYKDTIMKWVAATHADEIFPLAG